MAYFSSVSAADTTRHPVFFSSFFLANLSKGGHLPTKKTPVSPRNPTHVRPDKKTQHRVRGQFLKFSRRVEGVAREGVVTSVNKILLFPRQRNELQRVFYICAGRDPAQNVFVQSDCHTKGEWERGHTSATAEQYARVLMEVLKQVSESLQQIKDHSFRVQKKKKKRTAFQGAVVFSNTGLVDNTPRNQHLTEVNQPPAPCARKAT